MEKVYLTALHMIPGLGSGTLKKLTDYFGCARSIWKADKKDLLACGVINHTVCNNLLNYREKLDLEKLAGKLTKQGIKICTLSDPEYPNLLRNIYNPPIILYYRGNFPLPDDLTIAMVGARKATSYGKNAARGLAAGLAGAGAWVVSGAARGIDTAAHQGALSCGRTIAVLGCGVDVVYPPENAKLLSRISECGAVVSEYPPGVAVHAAFFPARNRIISGISRGTIVVEAAEKSGALITVDYALEQGRDVFAVPGSIFSPLSAGTHNLLKQGAKLVHGVSDVLEEYSISMANNEREDLCLDNNERIVYSVLTYENPMGIDEIVIKTNLAPSVVTYILLQLELRGLTALHSGQRYIRLSGRESGE